jgi:hypothetical protein
VDTPSRHNRSKVGIAVLVAVLAAIWVASAFIVYWTSEPSKLKVPLGTSGLFSASCATGNYLHGRATTVGSCGSIWVLTRIESDA